MSSPSAPFPPKQPDPAAVQRHFMFTLGQVNKQWRRTLDRLLAPMGLTQALWMPLMHLARSPEAMRQKDLAHSLALDSSSVVRLRSEEHTSELQSPCNLVCRLLLEKQKTSA